MNSKHRSTSLKGGNIGSQAFGQPCTQSVGLWGSRGFHGELLCLTERQHLQKCWGENLRVGGEWCLCLLKQLCSPMEVMGVSLKDRDLLVPHFKFVNSIGADLCVWCWEQRVGERLALLPVLSWSDPPGAFSNNNVITYSNYEAQYHQYF